MKKFNKGFWKKGLSVALAAMLSMSLLACGSQDTSGEKVSDENGVNTGETEYVYVPEYLTLETEEDTYTNSVFLQNGRMYYSTMIIAAMRYLRYSTITSIIILRNFHVTQTLHP